MTTIDTTEGPYVRISHDSADKIIVDSLIYHISLMCKASEDIYETPANKIYQLSAMLKTLEFYTTEGEFVELTKVLSVKLKPSQKNKNKGNNT
jgi:hypothetical protein